VDNCNIDEAAAYLKHAKARDNFNKVIVSDQDGPAAKRTAVVHKNMGAYDMLYRTVIMKMEDGSVCESWTSLDPDDEESIQHARESVARCEMSTGSGMLLKDNGAGGVVISNFMVLDKYGYLFFTGLNTLVNRKMSNAVPISRMESGELGGRQARRTRGTRNTAGIKKIMSGLNGMNGPGTKRKTTLTGAMMGTIRGIKNLVVSWVDESEIKNEGYAQFVKPLLMIKKNLEDITGKGPGTMTWKSHFLRFAKEAAYGILYLHGSRYWDEDAGAWRECVIHRDLKPENMLISKDWVLKLTDFGEARATDKMNMTMTTVGTPICEYSEERAKRCYTFWFVPATSLTQLSFHNRPPFPQIWLQK
jgi:hypothetical protein